MFPGGSTDGKSVTDSSNEKCDSYRNALGDASRFMVTNRSG